MFKRAAFAFSFLLCTVAMGADEPQWLKDARARESETLKAAEITSKDGWFKVRTPGKQVGSVEKMEGSYSVELDVGGDATVLCEVYPDGIDLAHALRQTLLNSLANIESSQGKIEVRALEGSDAGAYGAVPYMSLAWLYRVAAEDGLRVGALKQVVMEKNGMGIYCAHNDLGYTQTFATIARAFAESLESQEPARNPHYVEIATATMSGMKIGVAVSTLERDADGDIKALQVTSMLVPTQDGAVMSQDATHLYWLHPNGDVINAVKSEVSNGEVSHDLALKFDEGLWTVTGEVQGKAVHTTLPKDSQPGNWMTQAKQLRELMNQPDPIGREHSIGIWLAENPEKLTVAKTKILSKQDDRSFVARSDLGGINADLTLDKSNGMASTIDIKVGAISIRMSRVFASGTF